MHIGIKRVKIVQHAIEWNHLCISCKSSSPIGDHGNVRPHLARLSPEAILVSEMMSICSETSGLYHSGKTFVVLFPWSTVRVVN